MYDININFLKDRKLDAQSGATVVKKKETPLSEKLPMLIGGGVALALLGLVGGGLWFLNNQKAQTSKSIAELDAEIQRLQGQNAQINQIQKDIDNINQEIAILTSVFDQIKPWSAMLAEIGAVTPPNVQIQSIVQDEGKQLTITGTADSYENVNDFLLSLKNSRFLNSETTRLNSSSWVENPSTVTSSQEAKPQNNNGNQAENDQASANKVEVKLPQVVSFNIITTINNEPSQELVNLLNQRGAIGLVSRINTLRRKGALQVEPITEEKPQESAQPEKGES